MAQIELYLSNSSYSGCTKKTGILDTVTDLGMYEGEWESLSEYYRRKIVEQEMGYEEK